MSKRILLLCLCLVASLLVNAQAILGNTELTRELYTKAKNYTAKRDFPNAILVYNQLVQLEPKNLIYRRELAYAYYLGGDLSRSSMIIAPLLKASEADEETFLIAAQIFQSKDLISQAKDALQDGIRKFPSSGILYNESGKLLSKQGKFESAEKIWEEGIEKDPNFHMNYYNLCKSYFVSKRPLWAIIYGEIFINLERYSTRTEEIKRIVFDSYKQLIGNNQLANFASENEKKKLRKSKSKFERKANDIYGGLSNIVLGGVDMNNIVMLRTRFILRWTQVEGREYPFSLFSFMNEIIEEGHFEAYNQWLFGKAGNEKEYIKWVKENSKAYEQFEEYFRNTRFKNMPHQYYK